MEVKRSVCPYDCPDPCGLLVEVREGKAVRVSGDPDHPFTRGTLCSKMNRYQDTVTPRGALPDPCSAKEPREADGFGPAPGMRP